MSNVATRLLSLILLLQSKPRWKANELSEELNVSERTVHRYMAMLDEMGIPIYSERGPYGGFALLRGYKLPPLLFSAEEATVLYMGAQLVGELWGRTYSDAVTSVTAKLDNVLPDDLRGEVAEARRSLVIGGLTARDYRPWEATIHDLRRCIKERRCVHLSYRSRSGEETLRCVAPYALTLQWGNWYLVGFCHLREELRTFRVDRIHDLVGLDEYFDLPRDFSLRQYLAKTMAFEPTHEVVVRIDPPPARQVRATHEPWMHIEEVDSAFTETGAASGSQGAVIVRFPVASFDWVTGWVLGFGPYAYVLEPPELAERVARAAEGAARRYQKPSGP
ncbi:MAG: YafY family transcriptional regulator [Chloroflexi bacterium]|nr:YafY family transcriptional regulator [Chloroflexota bacterium]